MDQLGINFRKAQIAREGSKTFHSFPEDYKNMKNILTTWEREPPIQKEPRLSECIRIAGSRSFKTLIIYFQLCSRKTNCWLYS